MSLIYDGRGITIAGGSGAEVWDDAGKRYVDFMCGHGAALFGHAHPVLVSAAQKATMNPWTIGIGLRSNVRNELREVLGGLLDDGAVFLSNSGTESIEAAFKLAVVLRPGRNRFLALRRSFHGRTLGALGLTFNPRYRRHWKHLLPEVIHVEPENLAAEIDGNTAAVFVEPVQGEGGVHVLPKEIGSAVTDACRRNGAILVADEIQSGWGRCGAVLASGKVGLEPDITCLAKAVAGGLPIGVTIWRRELGDFPPHGQGTTYGGNPFVCSVALAAWRLLESEGYPARAAEAGVVFRRNLAAMKLPLVRDVRGLGLLNGVELTVRSGPVVAELQRRGVLALPAGPMVLRFLPPFVAEEEHYKRVLAVFEEALEVVSRET